MNFDIENFQPLIVIGAIALAIGIAILGWMQAKWRREAFVALAQKLGLQYTARSHHIPGRYRFLDKLNQGSNRYAFNILSGNYRDYPVQIFDYHYETYSRDSKGRRQTHHHYLSYLILEHQHTFPELKIYPETFLSKLGQMIGFEDIDFESVEFSNAFTVRSKDKKFAYDICHTRMMEFLLRDRGLSVEFEGPCVALYFGRILKVEEIERRLEQLCEIRSLIPQYLYTQ